MKGGLPEHAYLTACEPANKILASLHVMQDAQVNDLYIAR